MSERLEMYVYVIGTPGSDLVKIGRTTNDPYRRLASISTMSPLPLELRAYWRTDLDAEKRLHQLFQDRRRHGEWFDFTGADPVAAVTDALDQRPEPLKPSDNEPEPEPESDGDLEADETVDLGAWRPAPLEVVGPLPRLEDAVGVKACSNCTPADHAGLTMEQHIAHVADQAPPLTPAQIDRLRGLLKPAIDNR